MENTGVERKARHLCIHSAINGIEALSERVRDIQVKIVGPIPMTEDAIKNGSDPTLSDILCYSADRIQSLNDKIHQMLNEIEQALF